jgi:hypothetical protein
MPWVVAALSERKCAVDGTFTVGDAQAERSTAIRVTQRIRSSILGLDSVKFALNDTTPKSFLKPMISIE